MRDMRMSHSALLKLIALPPKKRAMLLEQLRRGCESGPKDVLLHWITPDEISRIDREMEEEQSSDATTS